MIAAIMDGGGFGNVVRLIFDNAIHAEFIRKPEERKLKESDFVQLGGTWFYKEETFMRSKKTFEYDVPVITYHPLECLQAIVMSPNGSDMDILAFNDMLAQTSATG
jgi:hypothetical protein